MAEDAAHGVVNHEGRVFNATSGTHTHEGLYVADGAVVPRPLGVNPLFTISALAERTCALLAEKLRGKIDYTFRPAEREAQSETSASSNTLPDLSTSTAPKGWLPCVIARRATSKERRRKRASRSLG